MRKRIGLRVYSYLVQNVVHTYAVAIGINIPDDSWKRNLEEIVVNRKQVG